MMKGFILLLTLLQIIFFAIPSHRQFFWFACMTAILELLIAVLLVVIFFVDLSLIYGPQWTMAELVVSAIFCVMSALSTIYYFCNIFYGFNFFYLLCTAISIGLVLAYGLNALIMFRARGIASAQHGGNQATATPAPPTGNWPAGSYPGGGNPA